MSHINLFVKEVFQFNQRDFWLLVSGNILLGLIFQFFEVHPFIQGVMILFMMFKSFTFLKATSVMPSVSSDFDRFSWKYFQGLPLNKKELILSLVIGNMLSMTPLIVMVVSFSPQIGDIFQDDNEAVLLETKLKIFLVAVPMLVFFSFSSLQGLITLPRRQYSRIDSRVTLYQAVRNIIIFSVIAIYSLWALIEISELTGINFGKYISQFLKFAYEIFVSWWIVPLTLLGVVKAYFNTLKTLQTEKAGYVRQNWNTKRDLSVITLCLSLNIFFFQQIDFGMPEKYSGNELTRSAYKEDYKKISSLISKGADLNKPNSYGFTPIMVAAAEGNYSMYKFLLGQGANLKGFVKLGKNDFYEGMNIFSLAVNRGNISIVKDLLSQGFDVNHVTSEHGHTPLHLASSYCRTEIADMLIEKKAYVNAVNKKGETPLHWASRSRCFGTVVALVDAGSNPLIKDKKGKLAKDNLKNYRQDLSYYLDKKSRAPAGK